MTGPYYTPCDYVLHTRLKVDLGPERAPLDVTPPPIRMWYHEDYHYKRDAPYIQVYQRNIGWLNPAYKSKYSRWIDDALAGLAPSDAIRSIDLYQRKHVQ